jgi:hypothetical protein
MVGHVSIDDAKYDHQSNVNASNHRYVMRLAGCVTRNKTGGLKDEVGLMESKHEEERANSLSWMVRFILPCCGLTRAPATDPICPRAGSFGLTDTGEGARGKLTTVNVIAYHDWCR